MPPSPSVATIMKPSLSRSSSRETSVATSSTSVVSEVCLWRLAERARFAISSAI